MKLLRRKRNLALLAAAILVLGIWVFGWGGGPIHVLRVSPEEVDQIELYYTRVNPYPVSVTEPQDIQTVLDEVNALRYTGNQLRALPLLPVFLFTGGMGGATVYEITVHLTDGSALLLSLYSSNVDPQDMEMDYELQPLGQQDDGFPLLNTCRGSMEWFYALYHKYDQTSSSR